MAMASSLGICHAPMLQNVYAEVFRVLEPASPHVPGTCGKQLAVLELLDFALRPPFAAVQVGRRDWAAQGGNLALRSAASVVPAASRRTTWTAAASSPLLWRSLMAECARIVVRILDMLRPQRKTQVSSMRRPKSVSASNTKAQVRHVPIYLTFCINI